MLYHRQLSASDQSALVLAVQSASRSTGTGAKKRGSIQELATPDDSINENDFLGIGRGGDPSGIMNVDNGVFNVQQNGSDKEPTSGELQSGESSRDELSRPSVGAEISANQETELILAVQAAQRQLGGNIPGKKRGSINTSPPDSARLPGIPEGAMEQPSPVGRSVLEGAVARSVSGSLQRVV